eukprot:CAMPEP_0176066318 /NCGR_PEP_ID=MMETSP0120_2-20121206/33094_1 /TAXON_ID=160619 /ORGANISM="Kryptoperidinium foliaceum, Strain CCMP 1326" /LENGTH=581 /DNA_ID=CAMNT_0017399921 /DNA_START=48 /DNA_END=1793 /DNA_ORIENTATION=+
MERPAVEFEMREVLHASGREAAVAAASPGARDRARLPQADVESAIFEECESFEQASAKLSGNSQSSFDLSRAGFILRRSFKVCCVTFVVSVFFVAVFGWPQGLIDDANFKPSLMSCLFFIGLLLVVLEDHIGVNKSAIMLMVSASMWTFLAVGYHPHENRKGHDELDHQLKHGLQDVGAIILFLLPAMGVVESIDHFDGFAVVTVTISKLTRGRRELLMPILGTLCFFMSAVIDNLTATIVCLKLLRHSVGNDRHLRHRIGGLIVMAANAGGAWSPIGDVTTTMLWLSDKITVTKTISWLFLPSLVVMALPLIGLSWEARREARARDAVALRVSSWEESLVEVSLPQVTRGKVAVLATGVSCILMVPVLKMATGLPPYLGMLLALGVLWFVTDTLAFKNFAKPKPTEHGSSLTCSTPGTPAPPLGHGEAAGSLSVVDALHKMDLTGLLFFAGVLLAVGALDTAGVLERYAELLVSWCGGSPILICTLLGVSSAVVDNVPLVQAAINMFGASTPTDDPLWQLVALAAGSGGSILSVGSIAGVTLMTMEGVGYLWYCRRISGWATLGFAAGLVVYQAELLMFT